MLKIPHQKVKYIADFMVEYKHKNYLFDLKGIKTQTFKLKMNLYKRLPGTLPLIVAKSLQDIINQLNNQNMTKEKLTQIYAKCEKLKILTLFCIKNFLTTIVTVL